MYSYIRFDTQYAVWISCRAIVAPKSNLIQLGSAHEWSGVWTGPKLVLRLTVHTQKQPATTKCIKLKAQFIGKLVGQHLQVLSENSTY